ncbi:MAG: hypothetical protein QM489_00430 [Candidatus Izemoplasma sp.]
MRKIIDVVQLLNNYNYIMAKTKNPELSRNDFVRLLQDILFSAGYFWDNIPSAYLGDDEVSACLYISYLNSTLTYSRGKLDLISRGELFEDSHLKDLWDLEEVTVKVEMPLTDFKLLQSLRFKKSKKTLKKRDLSEISNNWKRLK